MSEQRISMVERVLQRIEDHVAEWRKQDAARKREADQHRDELWAAAAEREKMLVEFINEEEARRDSLEEFARDKDRLVRTIPGGQGSYAKEMGVKGSWLVFEPSE